MNLISISATLLILLGATAGQRPDRDSVYVGKIVELSRDSIDLKINDSYLSIGFYGEAEELNRLSTFRVGEEVRVVFGTGTPPGETTPINKLLHIRRCVENDIECDADRKAEEIQNAKDEKAFAAIERRAAQCSRAMNLTLLKDPRYVPPTQSSRSESDALLKQLNSFTGQQRVCADKITNGHQSAVYDACELHHCGDNVGGGCEHIAGYALTDAAIKRAVLECKAK